MTSRRALGDMNKSKRCTRSTWHIGVTTWARKSRKEIGPSSFGYHSIPRWKPPSFPHQVMRAGVAERILQSTQERFFHLILYKQKVI